MFHVTGKQTLLNFMPEKRFASKAAELPERVCSITISAVKWAEKHYTQILLLTSMVNIPATEEMTVTSNWWQLC
jgi:hypothetical protein